MNIKMTKGSAKRGLMGLWLIFALLVTSTAYADLKSEIDQLIINKSVDDDTLSKRQKLFEYRCNMIEKYIGFPNTPTGRATKYSCDEPAVGIAFYAGKDLGKHPPKKVAQYFIDGLAKQNVKAEVFIKHDHDYGSSMAFYINGDSWLSNPKRPSEAVKEIEALAADAKLLLYTKGRIKEWPKSIK